MFRSLLILLLGFTAITTARPLEPYSDYLIVLVHGVKANYKLVDVLPSLKRRGFPTYAAFATFRLQASCFVGAPNKASPQAVTASPAASILFDAFLSAFSR